MAKVTKKGIYAAHDIQYKDGKILSPIGWIPELLKVGNSKTGKNVWTWSILPTSREFTVTVNGVQYTLRGSCPCSCVGCYATTGFYKQQNVITSMATNQILVENYIDFVHRAISAQLESIGRGEVRIHAAGDFATTNSKEYSNMWHSICKSFPSFRFWTYTKCKNMETLFDDLKNANIVKSVIPGIGLNFGTCEYIINSYYTLRELEESVYICKCGIDKNQHCERCGVCAAYKYVLFVEHSAAYRAEEDPFYGKLCVIVNNQ